MIGMYGLKTNVVFSMNSQHSWICKDSRLIWKVRILSEIVQETICRSWLRALTDGIIPPRVPLFVKIVNPNNELFHR